MIKMKTWFFYFFVLITGTFSIMSCQKEIDGIITGGVIVPANQKPKPGTLWTYDYYTYHSYGGIATSKIITHKAKTEETFGGEKWLNIVDVDADTTVYFLNTKTGGLYQYNNSSSYLLCKYPAAINDTYNTFNGGGPEDFTVKGVNDTLATGIGNVPLNYYEGVKSGYLIDLIWYNDNAWVVWKTVWRKMSPPSTAYYKFSSMFINNIVY